MSKIRLTKAVKEQIKQKFGGCCAYCGEELDGKWHADHMKPVIRIGGGEMIYPENDTIENLVPACHPCNLHKHSADVENYRRIITEGREQFLKSGKGKALVRMGLARVSKEPVKFWFELYTEVNELCEQKLSLG